MLLRLLGGRHPLCQLPSVAGKPDSGDDLREGWVPALSWPGPYRPCPRRGWLPVEDHPPLRLKGLCELLLHPNGGSRVLPSFISFSSRYPSGYRPFFIFFVMVTIVTLLTWLDIGARLKTSSRPKNVSFAFCPLRHSRTDYNANHKGLIHFCVIVAPVFSS